jgi:hypothetical protein
MFEIKKISKDSIPEALEKAERYRLLNQPWLAESICLDIFEADPENSKAVITLILAITDQFGTNSSVDTNQAIKLLPRLASDYERFYYRGIICERQGKSTLNKGIWDGGFIAYEWLRDAMDYYEKAEAIRPPGNDDSILRWNTCARMIMHHKLEPKTETYTEQQLE